MAKTKHFNSVMVCPPLTNAVFPTTLGYVTGRTDQVPVRVRMAWGGERSAEDPRHGDRSSRGGLERPRPSPEPPSRHRPAKVARGTRCVRSVDSTFYNARTKLVFLKDVSAVHYRPTSNKSRSLWGRISYISIYLCYFCFRWKTVSLVQASMQHLMHHVTVSLQQSKITLQNNCINNTSITQLTLSFYLWLKM